MSISNPLLRFQTLAVVVHCPPPLTVTEIQVENSRLSLSFSLATLFPLKPGPPTTTKLQVTDVDLFHQ